MSEYVVLLPGNEDAWEQLPPEQQQEVFALHDRFSRLLEERGHRITGGAELTHSRGAKVVRRTGDGDAVRVTDGPYTESVEQLGGFYVVESDDLEDLLEICGVLATVEEGVEVRACVPRE